MKLKTILCPIDFSEFNHAANEYASILAKATGARMIYHHTSVPEVPYGSYAYLDTELTEKRDQESLKEIVPTVEGVDASYVVELGVPADRIVNYAKENNVDLIVMGTHGRTGLSRVLMGSVAEAVIRKATCPVLAIKADVNVLQSS